jgi:hypothetical protein
MKKIIVILLSILIHTSSVHSQERRFGVGGLAGMGYGLNLSYAIGIDDSTSTRNELFIIMYYADWNNSYPQGTLWKYYEQQIYYSQPDFRFVSKGHDYSGVALGYRIIKKSFGYGLCLNILYKSEWKNYHSDIIGDIHSPIQNRQYLGLSGIMTAAINNRCRANLIIGSNIYMMVGIEWLFY